jgi:hypothetical protein
MKDEKRVFERTYDVSFAQTSNRYARYGRQEEHHVVYRPEHYCRQYVKYIFIEVRYQTNVTIARIQCGNSSDLAISRLYSYHSTS